MPIFFQQDMDECSRLAVWKIEEEEGFFLKQVPLKKDITHPHKRLQHLAGRYLLKYLFPSFPVSLIQIADTRKPFLDDEAFHFSISHCSDYAAVLVSREKRVGVDIELVSEKIGRIEHKFISVEEQPVVHGAWALNRGRPASLTLAWSCKEAIFKWYGQGEVDFRGHIRIRSIIAGEEGDRFSSIIQFKKNEDLFLDLHSRFFNGLCLSYVIT